MANFQADDRPLIAHPMRRHMDIVTLIVQLVSGAVGSSLAGGPQLSLGTAGDSIVGILGGGLGGVILNALGLC